MRTRKESKIVDFLAWSGQQSYWKIEIKKLNHKPTKKTEICCGNTNRVSYL